jgi:hypothetical protein
MKNYDKYDADEKEKTMQTGAAVMKLSHKNFGCVKLGVGSADPGSSDYHVLCFSHIKRHFV